MRWADLVRIIPIRTDGDSCVNPVQRKELGNGVRFVEDETPWEVLEQELILLENPELCVLCHQPGVRPFCERCVGNEEE